MRNRAAALLLLLAGVILLVPVVFAQTQYQSSLERQPAVPQDLGPWLGPWKARLTPRLMQDFGEKYLYAEANAKLGNPKPGEQRVVFIGDSITDLWNLSEYFPGKPYINRGIGGQITMQLLLRFHSDVVALKPAVVVINAGVNDVSNTFQIMSVREMEDNYEAMAEIARAHGIRVVFASILPVNNYTEYSKGFLQERRPDLLREVNAWLKNYCATHGCIYVDYYSAMIDGNQMLRRELTKDGLHPLAAGYKIMAPLVEAGIAQAMQSPGATATTSAAQQPEPDKCAPVDERRKAEIDRMLTDWANLARYREANAKLPPPAPGEDRVVFMGDSITDNWAVKGAPWLPNMKDFFPGKPYVNRGISGQTTPQMLIRFRQDVIALKPKATIILAGINDIAGNTGETTLPAIEDNVASMTQLARANGIRVVLASVLPAREIPWRPTKDVVQKVNALNQWIRDYAARSGFVYLDYYSAMVDGAGGLKSELALDAVHPNSAGYDVMAPLAQIAIDRALKQSVATRAPAE
jgi:lysophospholipase L1-like esterase